MQDCVDATSPERFVFFERRGVGIFLVGGDQEDYYWKKIPGRKLKKEESQRGEKARLLEMKGARSKQHAPQGHT